MAGSKTFDLIAKALEDEVEFTRLEARGTLRLSVKEAGLDPANIGVAEMAVIVDRVLPAFLQERGVDAPEAACGRLRDALAPAVAAVEGRSDTLADLFRRISD